MERIAELDAYFEYLCEALGHADRNAGLMDYCQGLMLPIERKSVEPSAAHAGSDAYALEAPILAPLCGGLRVVGCGGAVASPGLGDARLGTGHRAVLDHRRLGASQIRQALGRGGTPILWKRGQDRQLSSSGEFVAGDNAGQRSLGLPAVSAQGLGG